MLAIAIAFFLTEEMRRNSTHVAFKRFLFFIGNLDKKNILMTVNQKCANIGPII